MIAERGGKVVCVKRDAVSKRWKVKVKVTRTFILTYSELPTKPKVKVGDIVNRGDEIQ